MEKYKLKIIDIVDEAIDTKSYYFEKPAELNWLEGAHVHIGHIGYDEGELPNKALVRHMSITTLSTEGKLGITTKVPGSNSQFKMRLSELKIGDEVIFFKFGSRMYLRRSNRPLVFLSMGVGMATIRPVLLAYIKDQTDIPSIINVNVNSGGEFLYQEELDPYTGGTYVNEWLLSREDFTQRVTELADQGDAIYYIVGNDVFMKDTIKLLNHKGVKNEDIILDRKEEKLMEYFID
jgi:ferredoxin--NADP+ reductase